MRPPPALTELHRAAIRLVVIGVKITDAATVHGMSRYDLSRALHSPAGQEYAAHIRGICEHYTAAMHVLGLVPSDITRPGCRYKTPTPPGNAATLRRVAGQRLRARAGLPTGTTVDGQGPTDTDGLESNGKKRKRKADGCADGG